MLINFSDLPNTSRVWIYQCNRSFTALELEKLELQLSNFISDWTAHGSDLNAGYEIKYKRFIVIALDQKVNAATGCSIDASVHFIQDLEHQYNVNLLDKMNVSYKQGDYIAYKSLQDFKKMAKQNAISKTTIVFNNLVVTKEEYLNHWEVQAHESWHNRFL